MCGRIAAACYRVRFHRAACIVSDLALTRDRRLKDQVEVEVRPSDRATFSRQLSLLADELPGAVGHNSCPAVVTMRCKRRAESGRTVAEAEYECESPAWIGGYSELERNIKMKYNFTSKRCDELKLMTGGGAGACPAPPTTKQ